MEMEMEFLRKLPTPQELKEQHPVSAQIVATKAKRDDEIRDIFEGKSDKLILVIGPCSADNEDAVIDYISRLRTVQEKVADKIFMIPRIYTNKPRTTGIGYKGMLHQPDPERESDMLKGIIAIRHMHMRAVEETGFTCADEMLYPENHRYLSDLLSYVAIGGIARRVQLVALFFQPMTVCANMMFQSIWKNGRATLLAMLRNLMYYSEKRLTVPA